jgi:2,3,4,5-tetrahydropyridine-2,6-dicarboxylate N-succinyltransferase
MSTPDPNSELEQQIEKHFASGPAAVGNGATTADNSDALSAFLALRTAIEAGTLRAAEPDASSPTGWRVNAWVKRGILLGFRIGQLTELPTVGFSSPDVVLSFVDKDTYPIRRFTADDGIRIVPGGSAVRAGAFVARGVICVPPMYINVGAYVDEGTLVDSHALVGSCA